jgi:hypothetical protein
VGLASFLTAVVEVLEDARVPYMLTGSIAAAYYARPRATQDVDFVVDPGPKRIDDIVDRLLAKGFYVSREAAHEAYQVRGQFNAIDPEQGWKVDLIIRKTREFSKTEFQRRRREELFGIEVGFATLEDLIIAKLEWSQLGDSELQRQDIRNLLEIAGDSVDETYMIRWIDALGLQEAWERVTGDA